MSPVRIEMQSSHLAATAQEMLPAVTDVPAIDAPLVPPACRRGRKSRLPALNSKRRKRSFGRASLNAMSRVDTSAVVA